MTTVAVGNRRLLKLAAILDKADALHKKRMEPSYRQLYYSHPCGTPACALGHWAANNPRRWEMRGRYPGSELVPFLGKGHNAIYGNESAEIEFSLDSIDAYDLFGMSGCDSAKTAKQAAAYIRKFVAKRSK